MSLKSSMAYVDAPMDFQRADQLTAWLEQRGIRVWLSSRDGPDCRDPTEYWEYRMSDTSSCGAFMLLLASDGNFSDTDTRDLAERAAALGKPIFLIQGDEQDQVPDFVAKLPIHHWYKADGPDVGGESDRFIAALFAVLHGDRQATEPPSGGGAGPFPPPPQPPQPSPREEDRAPEAKRTGFWSFLSRRR